MVKLCFYLSFGLLLNLSNRPGRIESTPTWFEFFSTKKKLITLELSFYIKKS